jgi:hypothetical protein
MTKHILAIAFAALLSGACKSNFQSGLSIEKVLSGKPGTTPGTCTVSAGDLEFDFMSYNPADAATVGGGGHVSLVVSNTLVDPSTLNPTLNTAKGNAFYADQAVLNYEVIGGGTLLQAVSPASGTEVAIGSSVPVGVMLDPAGQLLSVAAGSWVRVSFVVEGHLGGGDHVKTAERDYVFQICGAAGCSTGCLAD